MILVSLQIRTLGKPTLVEEGKGRDRIKGRITVGRVGERVGDRVE